MSPTIRFATTDKDISACFAVMSQLRPHVSRAEFPARIRRMEQGGFRLVMLESGGAVRSLAGIRTLDQLVSGRILYVDDLVTDESERSRGFGKLMLEWLLALAIREGCTYLELDSALHRESAHRFYAREGLTAIGYHFRSATLR